MEFIIERKKTPVLRKVDVVVVGGGPAGFGAAVAAARNGAETLLVERYGFLGGMLTAGLVIYLPIDKLAPLEEFGETKALQGGVIQELVQRLVDAGGGFEPASAYKVQTGFQTHFPTDPEIMKVVLQEMMEESRANLLLHSFAVDVVKDGNEVKGIIIESKSGRQAVLADRVIDASGDADMAAAASAEYEKYPEPLMMSIMCTMANVDLAVASRAGAREEFSRLVDEATNKGELNLNEKKVLPEVPEFKLRPLIMLYPGRIPENWHRRGEAMNMIESTYGDCTNVQDLTRAEMVTRRGLLQVVKFLRKHVPGYERAYLAYTGTQVGVRESRRVLGTYYLTADQDMKGGLKHNDVIVKCRSGSPSNLSLCGPKHAPVFDIPYGCIVPKVIDGLLVAGRCISIDHKAATLLSPRDESTCMCLGQAAGTAAALSITKKVQPRDLDVSILQKSLREQGVI